MKEQIKSLIPGYDQMTIDQKIDAINEIKIALHEISPMRNEPVDCVLWVKNDSVRANDYNPNSVAPPEMELLRQSIMEDGYTQPIVSFKEDEHITVIDGFHRNRVGKEVEEVKQRVHGRLPVVNINQWKQGRSDRMASTIRHNRARGSHSIELMSTIVSELVEMGKGDAWICKHVGMSIDELLRMKQITGLASLFQNKDFSEAWEPEID
ncbi:MAG: phage Gaia [Bacteroidota bacterium]|jgi:ParB-like chromosome segregation protein Spo0J